MSVHTSILPYSTLNRSVRCCLNYVGPKVDANDASDEIGMLARYYPYCDIAAEEHSLELITVKLKAQTGVMWVAYCCQAFDSNGDLIYASGNKNQKILARWELEQIAGAWTVTDIREAP